MNSRNETGRLGELAAHRHLVSIGYSVLGSNVRCGRNEIDIVAEHEGTLVFVEVRTRRGKGLGTPEESITSKKRHGMLAAAHAYLNVSGEWERHWRIDIVAVEIDRNCGISRLDVIPNAVEM